MRHCRLCMFKPPVLAVLAAAVVSACTPAGHGGSATTSPGHGSSARTSISTGPSAELTQRRPCAGIGGFVCSTLRVPLDHSGHIPGALRLQVAAADNVKAPRGVLLFLTGGPGQPGVPFVPRIANRIAPALKDYRLVVFDQRGTGGFGAIDCPALQAAVGSSDITVPPRRSVQDCANSIGPNRRFYSTADTVADMDRLRQALGVQKMAVDGVSYGTFVAERYGRLLPGRASRRRSRPAGGMSGQASLWLRPGIGRGLAGTSSRRRRADFRHAGQLRIH